MSRTKDYYMSRDEDTLRDAELYIAATQGKLKIRNELVEYTSWRKFLAWFGFINLICTPFAVWYSVHMYNLIQLCLAK